MFPMSHLYIASRVLAAHKSHGGRLPEKDAAVFLLGSIAPDAVQSRAGFNPQQKLITHLCPDNGEAWGRVTANGWWEKNVRDFIEGHNREPFALGYAAHIFGDIFNNIYIWTPFRLANLTEAAKGYGNAYYAECGRVDTKLYRERMKDGPALKLLAEAVPAGLEGLVSMEEVKALRKGVLNENIPNSYPNKKPEATGNEIYIPWEKLLEVCGDAADFALPILFPGDNINHSGPI